MVSGKEDMSSACSEFIQNAWRKELCANCQRSRGEHVSSNTSGSSSGNTEEHGSSNAVGLAVSQTSQKKETDSPKPAKRNSLMAKSWTAHDTEGHSLESDDAKWEAMCRPDIEHSYEAIDEIGQQFQTSDISEKETARKTHSLKIGESNLKSKNENERVTATLPRDSKSRSRSSSRDKSPLPAPKPKIGSGKGSKENITGSPKTKTKVLVANAKSENVVSGSPKSDVNIGSAIKSSKTQNVDSCDKAKSLKVDFVTSEPVIIAEDGGYDNLFPDSEEYLNETEDEIKEILTFSEQEREWALLALKNTIWNSSIDNLKEDSSKLRSTQSREFEDIELECLWKPDRFANVKDCVALPSQTVYGTYPLRTKSGKSAIDSLFDGSSSLETIDETYETFLKYGFGDSKEAEIGAKLDRLIANEVDLSQASYDDPWGDTFGFDTVSDMNLLDEIKGEIDLDSSSAGMALVDLLNDVLSKYSTGTPSETDSVKNMDNFYEETESRDMKQDKKVKKEPKEIPTDLEAKVVTLAASLRLKQRAKRHAPRPPSCPPAPPVSPQEQEKLTDQPKSPSEQLELRAAQSKEPLFKMVPLGKPIGNSPVAQAQSSPVPRKTESESSLENLEGYKLKDDKEKPKRSGGITGFFRNFLRRSKGSDPDIIPSSETVATNSSQASLQGEQKSRTQKESSPVKDSEKTESSSPQIKLKVMPGRPVSPKPPGKPPDKPIDKPPDKPNTDVSTEDNETHDVNSPNSEIAKDAKHLETNLEQNVHTESDANRSSPVDTKSKAKSPPSSLNSSTKSTSSTEKDQPSPSSKSKEAPALPTIGPRQLSDSSLQPPKPRKRGSSDGGQTRSRPRTRDMSDTVKHRDTPNVPPPKPPVETPHMPPPKPQVETPHMPPPKPPIETPGVPPPKPPVAAKPKPVMQTQSAETNDTSSKPPPYKNNRTKSPARRERIPSTDSLEDEIARSRGARESHAKVDPTVLRKRAKSPKRFQAPIAPRSSLPNVLSDSSSSVVSSVSQSSEPKPLAFAKELELKLQKEPGTVSEVKKMSAPPPPSPASKIVPGTDDSQKNTQTNSPKDSKRGSPKIKKEPEIDKHANEKINIPDTAGDTKLEEEKEETNIPPVEHIEKIELPKPASHSRKSFLGKLNRKNRPPPPPSVKRTKSITESSVAGDLHLKKIDLKDISGPVVCIDRSYSIRASAKSFWFAFLTPTH